MKRIAIVALPAALLFASFGARAEGAGPIVVQDRTAQPTVMSQAATMPQASATPQATAAKPTSGRAMQQMAARFYGAGV